ncbi:MAG TPA: fasciclin domain-containing protein [Hanamia sp.]
MKNNILSTFSISGLCFFIACGFFISSCNKALPDATPIIYPPVNDVATSIGDVINSDTSYSFFKAAAEKTGQLAQLSDSNSIFTVFLPNNNAFRVSGIPSLDVVNSLDPIVLGGIVGYAIIPGQQYLSTTIPATFPNIQLPSSITIGALPGTPLPLKLSTFPSVSATGFYDNNIPVVKPDLKMRNGVIHLVAAIVAPPSQLLKTAMYSNPKLTYFKAAVARADSGQSGLNKIDSLLGYAVTNMTILAPSDAAFHELLYGLIYGSLLQQGMSEAQAGGIATALSGSPDVFSNPALYGAIPAASVRGILVYHFLATDMGAGFQPNIRVFSNNFSATPKFYTTLVNSVVAAHPGILAQVIFTGPFVTSLKFTGLGTFPPGGAPYSGTPANAISLDNHEVNGVYYIIDKVLLPQ